MGILKSLFGKQKEVVKIQPPTKPVQSQSSLNESRQCLGLDFLLMQQNLQNIKDLQEVCCTEEYSCVSATINSRPSAIVMCSMMYPAAFNKFGENADYILEIAKKYFDCKTTDIYAVGFGLINKNAPTEEEKGIYRIGVKYSVAVGIFHLISIADDAKYGLSIDSPVKLSMISDEYFYLGRLNAKYGEITDIKRRGSFSSPKNSNMLDRWIITVSLNDSFPLTFKYSLFLDAYAYKPYEKIEDDIKQAPIFFELVECEKE